MELDNVTKEVPKRMNKVLLITLGFVLLIQLSFDFYFVFKLVQLEKLENKYNVAIADVDKANKAIANVIAKNITNLDYINRLNVSTSLNSKYIVTDKLVVYNGRMALGKPAVSLDISPQPEFWKYFEGQGKINLPDRELRTAIQEVIYKFKEMYENYNQDGIMPKFDQLEIYITQKGYDVAKYANGKVVLSGEQ